MQSTTGTIYTLCWQSLLPRNSLSVIHVLCNTIVLSFQEGITYGFFKFVYSFTFMKNGLFVINIIIIKTDTTNILFWQNYICNLFMTLLYIVYYYTGVSVMPVYIVGCSCWPIATCTVNYGNKHDALDPFASVCTYVGEAKAWTCTLWVYRVIHEKNPSQTYASNFWHDGWKNGSKYVLVEKTTGVNMSWVSRMTGGNMFGREFFCIPYRVAFFIAIDEQFQ